MRSFIVFSAVLCLVAQTLGKPAPNEDVIVIRSESEHNGDGVYRYLYETSDGTQVEESGYLKPNGDDDPIQVAQGSFQYFSPEGELIRVEYIADENGFQPSGAHLPTPPAPGIGSSGGSSAAPAPAAPAPAAGKAKGKGSRG